MPLVSFISVGKFWASKLSHVISAPPLPELTADTAPPHGTPMSALVLSGPSIIFVIQSSDVFFQITISLSYCVYSVVKQSYWVLHFTCRTHICLLFIRSRSLVTFPTFASIFLNMLISYQKPIYHLQYGITRRCFTHFSLWSSVIWSLKITLSLHCGWKTTEALGVIFLQRRKKETKC